MKTYGVFDLLLVNLRCEVIFIHILNVYIGTIVVALQ